ncbi:hypothetical protein HMN09_00236200 [Mycena chlorophos]|uniref:Uncharacterized protein n=1 Tax=Mycena chlorophos TaxID=658473 RepID=A0A8H6TLS6_MYCCL|nr:hypothetical protein HMN09_00236200 [Mycena chlorophos]
MFAGRLSRGSLRLRTTRPPMSRSLPTTLWRTYASSPPPFPRGSNPSPVANAAIYALGAVGVGCLAYAAYDAYDIWRNTFPDQVRIPLKRGIAAKNAGDLGEGIAYKREAWNIAKQLPISSFRPPEPYLTLTGIAVDLAGDLEESGDVAAAYSTYSEALESVRDAAGLTTAERMRGVEIAVKLGAMVEDARDHPIIAEYTHHTRLDISKEEEERIRVWAVEEVLRLVMEVQEQTTGKKSESVDFANLKLPSGITKADICVPLLKLGEFYSQHNKPMYAMPLFMQSATLLIANGGDSVSRNDLCNGARLMNNISELVLRGQPTAEGLATAESWTLRSLGVLKIAQSKGKAHEPDPTCDTALAITLINAGMLRERAGDPKGAQDYLVLAMKQATAIGLGEAVVEIQKTIDRISQKVGVKV